MKEVTHLITDRETWYRTNRPITPQSPLNDSFTNDATGANSSRNSRPVSFFCNCLLMIDPEKVWVLLAHFS